MKRKKHLYDMKNMCMILFMGIWVISCTDKETFGGTLSGSDVLLSAYKEKVESRNTEGDNLFDLGIKYRIWIDGLGDQGIEATEIQSSGTQVMDLGGQSIVNGESFYGFTQNSTVAPAAQTITMPYKIELQNNGDYIDYLRGELKAPYKPSDYIQGNILQMPFKHIMSQVTFQVSKDTELDTEIQLVSIEMVGSNTDNPGTENITSAGTYQVATNEFVFEEQGIRSIDGKNMEVPSADLSSQSVKEVATILTFPTFPTIADETSTRETPLTYLQVTFKDSKDYYKLPKDENGNSTVLVPIYNTLTSVEGGTAPLEFKQNYHYTLHIAFSSDVRRVVTLVPKVYEWIEGEGDESTEFMQEQDMGQPVTFNGVLWSDRNLGATSGNPTRSVDDWYKSIGYLYQYGRNIPYYPYTVNGSTIDFSTPASVALGTNGRKVYPVIDYASWGLNLDDFETKWWIGPTGTDNYLIWDLDPVKAKNDYTLIDFGYYINNTNKYRLSYLKDYDDGWEKNTNTPCPPGWRLPTTQDFMGIMPSTGYSGNITFRIIRSINTNTGSWDSDLEGEYDYEINEINRKELENLKSLLSEEMNENVYKGSYPYLFREETDDFKDGTGKIGKYILSMGEKDKVAVKDLSNGLGRTNGENYTYHWGAIYGIKNRGTDNAYRIKWNIELINDTDNAPTREYDEAKNESIWVYKKNPFKGLLVISRYEASRDDDFTPDENGSYEHNVTTRYDWDHPVEVMYLPIGGYCDAESSNGELRNIGTEVWYATSEANIEGRDENDQRKNMVWIKYAGRSSKNSQAIVYSDLSRLGAAVFVRCVRDLY